MKPTPEAACGRLPLEGGAARPGEAGSRGGLSGRRRPNCFMRRGSRRARWSNRDESTPMLTSFAAFRGGASAPSGGRAVLT
jgi:hypothetical protein